MRILGVDWGSHSIKAVEIDSAFGRFEIRDYHELQLEGSTEPGQVLQSLISGLPKKPDRVAVAMSSADVTFRNLQLPTRGKKAIQAAIGFELEDELPFPLEQAVYDYTAVSQSKNATLVHVAASLKKRIAVTLAKYASAEIDPDLLTTEAWAYRTLFNRIVPAQTMQKPVLLVQIGKERTTLYVHWKGTPIMAREIAWGGRDITQAISQKYGISIEEAEKAKLDHGFVIPSTQNQNATPEQIAFSDTLIEPLQTLIRELHQAMLTCKSVTREPFGAVYLAGGTALLPGIEALIAESLEITAKPLQTLSSLAASGVTYSEHTDASFVLAASTALCLVGQDRTTSVNFRKGEFAKQGRTREMDFETIRRLMLASAAVASCLVLSLVVQSFEYKQRLGTVNSQLESSIKSFFNGISGSAVRNYIASPSTLRSSINKELTKQRELYQLLGPNPNSPLDFLRDLSTTIPPNIVVDVTQFQVGSAPSAPYSPSGDSNASISVLVSNPQAAQQLANELTKKVSGLQQSKLEEVSGTAPDKKRWKLTFSGKPIAASPGLAGANGGGYAK